ncbi:MAG: DUF87 domain-containing protein [Candidatus Pacearchaeota archaeon]
MSYQIPQQLEYKEKIMFGLTFKQLAYAFSFGFVAVFFFRKISNTYIGFSFALFFSFLAICFMFFNLDRIIKDYWIYLRFRQVEKNNPKLKKFLGVKEIKDDLIITDKGKKISILKIQPINFAIKQKSEREAIMYSFQKFLNSIDFPTQILMRTESINLDDYLESLKSRIKQSSFSELFENYKKHLHEIIENNKIMNRVFYLVIPEDKNIDIQTSICIERLITLNLKVKRLKNNELKQLFVDFFLGDRKGDLINAISPKYINNNSDYLETNDQYYRIVYASGYPRMVEAGFLDRVVSSLGDFDLSIHIKPYPIERMLIDLNKELQKQRADLYSMNIKGIINPTLEIQYKDTRNTLENLQKGQERLFNISLYINCKSNSLKELDLLTKKVESELNSLMIQPKIAGLRMLQGLKSIAPLGIDELKANRNITTEALSAFFPFTSQFLEVDDTGVWLGMNKNNIPIIKDIFKLSNPNGLVLAQSGGGKSYFCKLLITRYLLNGTKVMIIDPQGEYANIVNYFKGQRILLSRNSKTIINPLDLMGHEYAEKRLSLMDLMSVMLGTLTEPQKAFMDRALTEAYSKKGINENPKTWEYEPPILSDVLYELVKMEKKAIQLEKTTIRSLMNRLGMYTDGVFSFLNRHTNINFENNLVCFDIGAMPKQVKPTVMFLVLDYLYMKMKSDLTRKILLIDESWSLLSRAEDASYIFEIVKTCRKFNLGLLLINQEVEGLLTSQAGKSVLANSSYTLLMRQKPAVIDSICKTFHLSDSERAHILTANIGEGLLIMEDDHSQIKVIASPEEHKLITTNPDEILKENENNKTNEKAKQYKQPKNQIKKQVNVDKEKGFYKLKGLTKQDEEYLFANKYKEFSAHSLLSNKKEKYLIKPRFNESPQHFFLIQDIADYLKKFTDKIQLFETKKPDLVFKINDKEYAIEVETGKMLRNNKKQLLEKVKMLNKDYQDRWFFVVTNRKDFKKYNKFGKTLTKLTILNQLHKICKN